MAGGTVSEYRLLSRTRDVRRYHSARRSSRLCSREGHEHSVFSYSRASLNANRASELPALRLAETHWSRRISRVLTEGTGVGYPAPPPCPPTEKFSRRPDRRVRLRRARVARLRRDLARLGPVPGRRSIAPHGAT